MSHYRSLSQPRASPFRKDPGWKSEERIQNKQFVKKTLYNTTNELKTKFPVFTLFVATKPFIEQVNPLSLLHLKPKKITEIYCLSLSDLKTRLRFYLNLPENHQISLFEPSKKRIESNIQLIRSSKYIYLKVTQPLNSTRTNPNSSKKAFSLNEIAKNSMSEGFYFSTHWVNSTLAPENSKDTSYISNFVTVFKNPEIKRTLNLTKKSFISRLNQQCHLEKGSVAPVRITNNNFYFTGWEKSSAALRRSSANLSLSSEKSKTNKYRSMSVQVQAIRKVKQWRKVLMEAVDLEAAEHVKSLSSDGLSSEKQILKFAVISFISSLLMKSPKVYSLAGKNNDYAEFLCCSESFEYFKGVINVVDRYLSKGFLVNDYILASDSYLASELVICTLFYFKTAFDFKSSHVNLVRRCLKIEGNVDIDTYLRIQDILYSPKMTYHKYTFLKKLADRSKIEFKTQEREIFFSIFRFDYQVLSILAEIEKFMPIGTELDDCMKAVKNLILGFSQ